MAAVSLLRSTSPRRERVACTHCPARAMAPPTSALSRLDQSIFASLTSEPAPGWHAQDAYPPQELPQMSPVRPSERAGLAYPPTRTSTTSLDTRDRQTSKSRACNGAVSV